MSNQLGVIGMGVMGLNLALNAASKGFNVAVYNRTTSRMENALLTAEAQQIKLNGYAQLDKFVEALEKPRKIVLLVQAGQAVDATLNQLTGLLDKGDIVVDGGNEFYSNTDKRAQLAKEKGIHFMGMGVSGGEEGARHGPALMPGGDQVAYDAMAPILKAIAAKSPCGVCVDYMGAGSAGNYVKMIHNGIEYGDMQLIAESYDLIRSLVNITDNGKIAEIFKTWNTGRMASYLIEITATVLNTRHPHDNSKFLVDDVLDVAGAKGTGKWTAQEACEKGVPCPTIQAALDARNVSGRLPERKGFHESFKQAASGDATVLEIKDIETALFLSKLCSYAQGISLIREASKVHAYEIEIANVARCWTGGCIIRAELLSDIMKAYTTNPCLQNLLLAPEFASHFTKDAVSSWKHVVTVAIQAGVPIPAISASLNWFLMLSRESLPLNIVQAQRDFFGAHTFRLKSNEAAGPVHADWNLNVFKAAP